MKTRRIYLVLMLWLLAGSTNSFGRDLLTVVDRPPVAKTNHWYVGNRAPLEPSRLIPLPVGAIQPRGWLLETLHRQRNGLCGNLGEISIWLAKENNAWLSKDGKGAHGWEEVPYWLRGYIQLAGILHDSNMLAESQTWIEGVLNSQRPDGDFGPDQKFGDDGSRDFWANMLMLFSLETYYERTQDHRVLELMTRYFRYQLSVPDEKFLTHYWQKMRGGDNLYSVYWLYNRTGDAFCLSLADKIHRCTANWELRNDLPNWHNVNIAEGFREPATHFLQSHNPAELQATSNNFYEVRKRYGQVPGGMFGGDEDCRPGYTDPRQGIETCGIVEQMFSDGMLLQISGDPFWADNCENVAFNMYPAALMPDLRALRYLTAPNMAVSDAKNHSPGIENSGPFLLMNPFSSRCCQHNHSIGWPTFNNHLWYATPDDGICAAIYSASEVSAKVGNGTAIRFEEDTHYPFAETVRFTLHTPKAVRFPLYLRIPSWCHSSAISVNNIKSAVAPEAGKYLRLERKWKDGDSVGLELPMKVSLQQWTTQHDSRSVNYGPLTMSLRIDERYVQQESTRTAIGDSGWQPSADPSKWPSFEIDPASAWNYGLVLPNQAPEDLFVVHRLAWPADDFPFTPQSAPLQITAKAKRITDWSLDRYGLCAPLPESPAKSDQPVESIRLIPMGAARLRISVFPIVD